MKDILFQKLKTAYSSLGLGDGVLMPIAASLASTGLVTADNVDAVVAAQKDALESIQKSNDKRAEEASAKAKAESARDKARLDEASAKERAELERQLSELRAKIDASAAPASTPAPMAQPQPAPQPVADDKAAWFKAEQEALRKQLSGDFEERLKSIIEGNKALTDTVNALRAENESMKAAEAAKARAAFITSKAKELGIPEWRVQEGFGIAGDATDEAITEHLTKVSENIRAQVLPDRGVGLPMGQDGKPDPKAVEAIAARLVSRN